MTVWHLYLVLALLITPYVMKLLPRKVVPSVIVFDFVVDPTPFGDAPDEGEDDEEAEAPPQPPPDADAPDAVARPTPTPAAVTSKSPTTTTGKPKTQVQVSKTKVKRTVGGSTSTRTPGRPDGLTPEEIRRRLAMGARIGTYNSAIPSDAQLDFGRIYRILYDAWEQPSAVSVRGATVTAELKFAPDGAIVRSRVSKPSGIPEFDRSVEKAIKAVDRIPGLPLSFVDKHPLVTVLFEVQE